MIRLVPVAAALCVLGSLAPAAPPGKFTFVDLKPYANQKLTDNFIKQLDELQKKKDTELLGK